MLAVWFGCAGSRETPVTDESLELVTLATRIADPLRRSVKARAALEGRSVQGLVTQALEEYLENHDAPEHVST